MGQTIEEIKLIIEKQAQNLEAFGYRRQEYYERVNAYIDSQKKADIRAKQSALERKTK